MCTISMDTAELFDIISVETVLRKYPAAENRQKYRDSCHLQ